MSKDIFADMGFEPEEASNLTLKSDIAISVIKMIKQRHLTQRQVADLSGWTQPKVSALMRMKLSDISIEKLLQVSNALNYDVRIVMSEVPATRKPVASVEFLQTIA